MTPTVLLLPLLIYPFLFASTEWYKRTAWLVVAKIRSFVYSWNAFAGGVVEALGSKVQGRKDMLAYEETANNRFDDLDEPYPRDMGMLYESMGIRERFHTVARWAEKRDSAAARDGRLHPGDIPVQRLLLYQTAFPARNG
jgi:hypothetical protein